jgi:hypothetical protein
LKENKISNHFHDACNFVITIEGIGIGFFFGCVIENEDDTEICNGRWKIANEL